jgi:hypothetical protein
MQEQKKPAAVVNYPLPGGVKLRNDFIANDLGWVCWIERKVEKTGDVEYDDKRYQTHKSATQQTSNSSNQFGSK